MAETVASDMPRAKRLKLLREAKERKERLDRGEEVEEVGAGVENVALSKSADAPEVSDGGDRGDEAEVDDSESAGRKLSTEAAVLEQSGDSDDAADEGDLLTLAPKRANWDIERDIAPMLQKLEKRTQYAIVEILRTSLRPARVKWKWVGSSCVYCVVHTQGCVAVLCAGEKLAAEQAEEDDDEEDEEDDGEVV